MIKLIENELIKIFKRKSIYVLLVFSLIAIVIYNYMNPDQNDSTLKMNTDDLDISILEKGIEDIKNRMAEENTTDKNEEVQPQNDIQKFLQNLNSSIEGLVIQNIDLEFAKLYDRYEKESWQRYALNEERNGYSFENNSNLTYNHDIKSNIKTIKDYELNPDTQITKEQYDKAVEKYNGYVKTLDSNNWKEYVTYRINSLKEEKDLASKEEANWLQIEIDINQMRLDNNIEYKDNRLNTYIEEYRSNYYSLQNYEEIEEKDDFVKKQIKTTKGEISLLKYAIEHNITQDISSEKYNILLENKIDARISFIRIFEHFDLIIVIIAIYISCMIVTEEMNKRTIKNLLTKPHKRSSILFSKMIACLITVVISMIFVCVVQYIVGGLIYGFDSYGLDYIGYNYNTDEVFEMNIFEFIVLEGLTKLPMYIIVILFCIFIGTINNNTSMTMILTLIIFMIGNSLLEEWSKSETLAMAFKYFITNNWDFSTYLFGNFSEIPGINLEFSIIVYIIYSAIFIIGAMKTFENKEISNQ